MAQWRAVAQTIAREGSCEGWRNARRIDSRGESFVGKLSRDQKGAAGRSSSPARAADISGNFAQPAPATPAQCNLYFTARAIRPLPRKMADTLSLRETLVPVRMSAAQYSRRRMQPDPARCIASVRKKRRRRLKGLGPIPAATPLSVRMESCERQEITPIQNVGANSQSKKFIDFL